MNNKQLVEHQKLLFEKALEILSKKRQDYASDEDPFRNFRNSTMMGVEPWRGAGIRLMDKLSRFVNLASKGGIGAVSNESIEDTIVDALNYLVIMEQLWLETQPKRKKKK